MDYSMSGSSVHGIFPGKNTGVFSHALLQGIFLILSPTFPIFQMDPLLAEPSGKTVVFYISYCMLYDL